MGFSLFYIASHAPDTLRKVKLKNNRDEDEENYDMFAYSRTRLGHIFTQQFKSEFFLTNIIFCMHNVIFYILL